MRSVDSLTTISNFGGREVKGVSGVTALRPLDAHEAHPTGVTPVTARVLDGDALQEIQEHRRLAELPDRRKICRRVHKQVVLLDSRSGSDRRHGHSRDTDAVDHIDIKV
jgi:hypothetical protein